VSEAKVIIIKGHCSENTFGGYIIHVPAIPVQPTQEVTINPACYGVTTSLGPLRGFYMATQ